MKSIFPFLTALFLSITADGEGISAIKTATGVKVVRDFPDLRFTFEIPGKKIEPSPHPEHFFIKVDGTPFQVQCVAREKIFPTPVEISPKGLLLAHRDWETRHLEKALGADLTPGSEILLLGDDHEALLWSYRMPKGMDGEVLKQLYLTRAEGAHVVVLNAAVLTGTKEEAVRKILVSAANRFSLHDGPVDLARKPESSEEPPPANLAATPGRYVFELNRFGGITLTIAKNSASVVFVQGNKQGEEITWQAKLAPGPGNTWVTKGGTSFKLERMEDKIVHDSNRGINSGYWKLTLSGEGKEYADVKKKIPSVAFGDTGKTEYHGEKADE